VSGAAALRIAAPVPEPAADLAPHRPPDRAGREAGRMAAERETDRLAEHLLTVTPDVARPIAVSAPAAGLPTGGLAPALAVAGPGRPLPASERAFFGPHLGGDLGSVRVHCDGHAAAMNRTIAARAFTRGEEIFFGAGEFRPETIEGRRLIAHELIHTRQGLGRDRLALKTLTDIPEATRTRLKISRTAPQPSVVASWIASYFDPAAGTSASPNQPVEYGNEITDANQKKGLEGVAYELVTLSRVRVIPATATEPERRENTDPESWPLGPDSILDLALDTRPHGGPHAIFRFIRYMDGTTEKVLIETARVLAPAPAPAGATTPGGAQQPAATPGVQQQTAPAQAPAATPQGQAPAFTGDLTVGAVTIHVAAGFGDARGRAIRDAVALLPDPIRTKADDLHFEYGGSGKGPTGQNGHYDPNKDIVTLWDDMFAASPRRVGSASETSYQIVHELGHVIDMRPMMAAQLARDRAQTRKKGLEKQMLGVEDKFIDPNDPLGGAVDLSKDPRVVAEKTRIQGEIDKVKKEIEKHEKDMKSAKSVAGGEVGKDTESMLTDFAKAIAQDGVTARPDAKKRNRAIETQNEAARAAAAKAGTPAPADRPLEKTLAGGVSLYADTDLMEAFAENFAYYVLDENLLKAIRPKTHAFFAAKYPKTTPATGGTL
jgi:hypothetical protein